MGTLRDTPFNNYYGEGKQLEVTDNSGQRYIIRNTFSHNFYGDGYQKEVVEQPSNYTSVSEGTDYSIIYGISFLLGFFTLCAFSTGGLNVISVMFLISTVITLVVGIIKAPHTIITIVKIIIVTIIFGFIVMLPFLPGILECARF